MSEGDSGSGGVSVVGLLTVAFVVLKLTGQIDWTWWWVLSPVWITAAIVAVICLIVIAVAVAYR